MGVFGVLFQVLEAAGTATYAATATRKQQPLTLLPGRCCLTPCVSEWVGRFLLPFSLQVLDAERSSHWSLVQRFRLVAEVLDQADAVGTHEF